MKTPSFPYFRRAVRGLNPLPCVCVFALLSATAFAVSGTINFENDADGAVPNGFHSVDSNVIAFTDTLGAELQLVSGTPQTIGRSLACFGNDASAVQMDFSAPMQSLSLAFGNDDPGATVAGDLARLSLFNGATLIGQVDVVMNRNNLCDQTIAYTGASFNRATFQFVHLDGTPINLIKVIDNLAFAGDSNIVVFADGDDVPGAGGPGGVPPGAKFVSFGTPAINGNGVVAVLGEWSSPTGAGAGIFVGQTLLMKIGDAAPRLKGAIIKTFKDPVLDDDGHVAFPAVLAGQGISPTNDSCIVSNAPGGTLAVIARKGATAPGAPAGAVWDSFTSVAAPGGGGGVLFLGFLAQGPAGISAANDMGLWSADHAGVLHLMLQEGMTTIAGKTVKTFAVLKAVSGTPGQTHAFDSSAKLVSKVTFTDGAEAVVESELP